MDALKDLGIEISPDTILEYMSLYGLKVLGALAIFFVGKWVVNKCVNFSKRMMLRAHLDPTLVAFGGNILYTLGLTFVVVAVLGQVGVQTASLVAVLGAAGLAVGLALQGSLSNFAAGVMIIIFRPFRVGHYIEAAGVAGTVRDLNIFTTTLDTFDNKRVVVPNASITEASITNYSANPTRRLDMIFGIGYGDDIAKAKIIAQAILDEDTRVLKEPAAAVVVGELADNSVNIYVRPWVSTGDYWDVRFDVTEKIKLAFDENGISIPFPQRDVHLRADPALLKKLAA